MVDGHQPPAPHPQLNPEHPQQENSPPRRKSDIDAKTPFSAVWLGGK
jgi:hypothetical protein